MLNNMSGSDSSKLRPFERQVLRLHGQGHDVSEIATKFRRSPEFVSRVITWTEIPRTGSTRYRHLRPMERRVLDMRAAGVSRAEIANRFKKSERFIRQVEGLAHFKESQRLLGGD